MFTRKMNTRITIFTKEGGQNEDGEVVAAIRKDVLTCWAEVSKSTLKDYQLSLINQAATDNIQGQKDTKIFLVRYYQKAPFDNSMWVDFNGVEYKIISIEPDYASKDMTMISTERVT